MKIGIITHFYGTINYGGMLQAFALTKVINSIDADYDAEQIQYNPRETTTHNENATIRKKNTIRALYRKLRNLVFYKRKRKILKKRKESFFDFATQYVPMSTNVYSRSNCYKIADNYDVFITGSDQVWNPMWYDEVYRLDCIPTDKIKMSYAAGLSNGALTEDQQQIFRNTLSSYSCVSVREKDSISKLSNLTSCDVSWVLDPTLLLSGIEWGGISASRLINGKYIFCFFLSETDYRKEVEKYARKKGLKIACISYLTYDSKNRESFGNIKIDMASPKEFLSLIKYAECVFTDSFHATVFSHIFKKDFFVFNRKGAVGMNDRIYSLTSLFDTQNRFCDTDEKATLSYIENLAPVDYSKGFPKFDAMKEKSINYLKENLKRAEERINGNK